MRGLDTRVEQTVSRRLAYSGSAESIRIGLDAAAHKRVSNRIN